MYRVKIDEQGWNHFSDYLGHIKFTDGISDRPLTEREVEIVGSSLRISKLDSDEQVGPATNMILKRDNKAPITESLKTEEVTLVLKVDATEALERIAKTTDELVAAAHVEHKKWTKEDLELLASEKGIQGIREVGADYNVKGVQINAIIDKILEAQDEKKEAE